MTVVAFVERLQKAEAGCPKCCIDLVVTYALGPNEVHRPTAQVVTVRGAAHRAIMGRRSIGAGHPAPALGDRESLGQSS